MKPKKFWNKLKYWQKGGIIFSLLGILISILAFNCSDTPFCWGVFIATMPVSFASTPSTYDIQPFVLPVFITVQYFLIGALIGLIMGKVKKK
jgi:hypothetical protein